jgi:TonB-dependent receptor
MSDEIPQYKFHRTKLSAAIRGSLSWMAVGALASGPVFGQDAAVVEEDDADAPIEEIISRGVRSSLETAQALKRNSSVIVDSVTAEDIGALPDRSVTETLQRMPGVAINRFAAGRDPDHFSVEGSGVVVRGLSYVRSEVNSRDSFTANNGRGLSFADVPAELLAGVDVFKSPSANRVEGGIAGTVNLRTRRPFDSTDAVIAFSAENNYGDFIDDSGPTGSVLGTYRWETDAGEFGILGSAVYSQILSRADKFQISNFAERTLYSSGDVIDTGGGETAVGTVLFPRGAVAGTQEFDKERYGYSAAFQWRNPDKTVEATFQFLRSDAREAWTEHTMEIATDVVRDQGDSRAVPGTSFEFDDQGRFESGYITAPTGWRDDQWSGDPRTPAFGLQGQTIGRAVDQQYVTDDLSLNLVFDLPNDWAMKLDFQHVDSTVDNLDISLWGATFQDAMINMHGSSLPDVQFTAPQVACSGPAANDCPTYLRDPGTDSYLDPYNTFYRAAMDHIEESEGTSDAFMLDFEKSLGAGSLSSVSFGVRYAERDQTARFSTYNWGSLSEIWGSGGPVWLDDPVAANGGEPQGGYESFDFQNFMDGQTGDPMVGGRIFYDGPNTNDYQGYVDYATTYASEWASSSWVSLADRSDAVPGTPFLLGEVNPVLETNNAAYVMLEFDKALDNGWDLSGNVGVRYTQTDRKASGYQSFTAAIYTTDADCAIPPMPGESVSPFCNLPASVRQEARDFSNGAVTPFKANLDYDYVLPSINVKLTVAEGVQFRAAYFEGVAPPDFGLTRAYYSVPGLSTTQEDIDAGGGRPIARFNAGNPYLEPVESRNLDLTAEWYFADVGQLSFAVFFKELDNIRTNDVARVALTNNGATFDAIVTTAINSKETGKIKGFEIAYQQTYDNLPGWMSGFGLSTNYTYVSSDNVPQSTLSETDPDVSADNQSTVDISRLPLEGLSEHTFNFAPFYDYGKFSARVAYSWRDEFLLTIRDVIVPFQPIYNEATGQLDASVFYNVTDNWKVGVQAVNLTGEIIRTSAVVNDDLLQAARSWYLSDTRYSLIVRGTF